MIEELKYTLTNFNQINYDLVPNAILLNRIEKKYLLNNLDFANVINQLSPNYLCLEINNSNINNYYNTYFDTNNFDFYLQHHNNVANRLKIRKRFYETTNTTFLEIKQKNNERTLKNRMQLNTNKQLLNADEIQFISQNNFNNPHKDLKSIVQINYKRLSLINKDFTERLSFDFDIEFISPDKSIKLTNLIIAESKQTNAFKSPFINVIKQNNIGQTSFSKYCIAVSKLYPIVKHNNFKKQLTLLEEILYANALNAVTN